MTHHCPLNQPPSHVDIIGTADRIPLNRLQIGGGLMFDKERGELPPTTRRESADNYASIVFISANYRVINCRDDIQWIIQHRCGKSEAGARWRSLKYCTTRKALIRDWHALTGASHKVLGALPQKFGGEQ